MASETPLAGFVAVLPQIFLGIVMGLWVLGNLGAALPSRTLRRWSTCWNSGYWFARWAMFADPGGRVEPVERFVLEFRDHGAGAITDWTSFAGSRSWVWHGGLLAPGRKLADRIHRLGRDLAAHPERHRCSPPALVALAAVSHPPPAGSWREFRVRRLRSWPIGGWSLVRLADFRRVDEVIWGKDRGSSHGN